MNPDHVYLLHIQKNIANIQRLSAQGKGAFMANEDTQAAILYYLQTLSESTTRLSGALRSAHPEIAWQKIRGFRNRVVHGYLNVDVELVWTIVDTEIAPLHTAIQAMLDAMDAEE